MIKLILFSLLLNSFTLIWAAQRDRPFIGLASSSFVAPVELPAQLNGVNATVDVFCDITVVNVSTINQLVRVRNVSFVATEMVGGALSNLEHQSTPIVLTGNARAVVFTAGVSAAAPGAAAVTATSPLLSTAQITLLPNEVLRVTQIGVMKLTEAAITAKDRRMMCTGNILVDDVAGATQAGAIIASGSIEYVANHFRELLPKFYGTSCPGGKNGAGVADTNLVDSADTRSAMNQRSNYVPQTEILPGPVLVDRRPHQNPPSPTGGNNPTGWQTSAVAFGSNSGAARYSLNGASDWKKRTGFPAIFTVPASCGNIYSFTYPFPPFCGGGASLALGAGSCYTGGCLYWGNTQNPGDPAGPTSACTTNQYLACDTGALPDPTSNWHWTGQSTTPGRGSAFVGEGFTIDPNFNFATDSLDVSSSSPTEINCRYDKSTLAPALAYAPNSFITSDATTAVANTAYTNQPAWNASAAATLMQGVGPFPQQIGSQSFLINGGRPF